MHQLWPPPDDAPPTIDDATLARLYAYPAELTTPYVRVNFVSSADGAVTYRGRSGGLSDDADRAVFVLLRALAEVVLVGAGTVRAEDYRGARAPRRHARLRQSLGLAVAPPIAVLTRSADLAPESPLFTDTHVAPIVFTCASAPQQRCRDLTNAGADVEVLGDGDVPLVAVLDALHRRGLHRVLCEGGPTVFGELAAAGLVDELCLTVSAMLAGGGSGRITDAAPLPMPTRMRLASALTAADTLMLRYRVASD